MVSQRAVDAAAQWRRDVKSGRLTESFAVAGVATILLKGPAFAAVLYPDGVPRPSIDCDLLIDPRDHRRAEGLLREWGFQPQFLSADAATGALHADAWSRVSDGFDVDLHTSLPEVDAPSELVWSVVSGHTAALDIAGIGVTTLDEAGTALLACLHLAHHGVLRSTTIDDLRRAIDLLKIEHWREAHRIALDLGAEEAFGQGLRLTTEGRRLSEQLGVPASASVRRLLQWEEAPWGASALEALASAPSLRARWTIVRRVLVPSARAMRLGTPLAGRGPAGMVAAYAIRPMRLLLRAPAALAAWRRARRTARR